MPDYSVMELESCVEKLYYYLQDPDPVPTPYFSVPSTPTEKIEDRLNLLIELKLELEDGELKTEVDDGSFLCCVAFNQTILVFGVITTDMARFSKPEVVPLQHQEQHLE